MLRPTLSVRHFAAATANACIAAPAQAYAAVARRRTHSSRTLGSEGAAAAAAAGSNGVLEPYRRPEPVYAATPLDQLHGDTHRLPRVLAQVPAQLTPEEQGTGASFRPTLLRPAEWIRTSQPALPTPLPWHPAARRTGLLGTKLGMMQLWDHHGVRVPITVIKIDSQVVGQNNQLAPKKKTLGLQIGLGTRKLKSTPKSQLVHFAKQGVAPKRKIVEFAVSPDAMLPVGWTASVRHFVPGQYLDVTGTSTGKGFQGGMKLWNFGGLNASHGVSVTHRSIGATGSRQDPGRVFKNKKMPGRMGGKRVTKQNLKLFKIDVKNNLLFVKGTLPGHRGQVVMLRDAVKRPWHPDTPPPFPTYNPKKGDELVEEIVCAPEESDPFAFGVA